MSALSPASEVILRQYEQFIHRRVLFAGDLQDTLPSHFNATDVRVWSTQYHRWHALKPQLGEQAHFTLLAEKEFILNCDTVVYYWPKNKQEAQFQLYYLLAILPVGTEFFIAGENRSGVRSVEKLLAKYCHIQKIDNARRCSLYHAQLEKQADFDLTTWWHHYDYQGTKVATLPGVFSAEKLDIGSQLLLTVLKNQLHGKILDMGCGSGVLAVVAAKQTPQITHLTLCDVSAAALMASQTTLEINEVKGNVIASDVFSNIHGHFDFIIANPPFHDGLRTQFTVAESLIKQAINHLHIGGKLFIVANSFLPYADWLSSAFGNHQVVAQTGRFKVYQATRMRKKSPAY